MKQPPTAPVLLVDDTVEIRYLLRILLANVTRCHVAGEAENGREAIELTRTLQPVVVVLDVQMPVLGGLDALPQILAAAPETKVIVYSSEPAARAKALELGAFRYLDKGGDPLVVAHAVREALDEDSTGTPLP